MRKIVKLVTTILCLLLCVGCMDTKVNMNINEDKSVDLSIGMNLDLMKMMRNMLDAGFTSEDICSSSCPYDKESMEYQNCLNECQNNTNLSDEELKKYLDESIENGELDLDEIITEEDKEEYIAKGFIIDVNLNKENYVYTIDIKKHFDNIDDLTGTSNEVNFTNFLNEENGKVFTKSNDNYKANITVDLDEINEELNLNSSALDPLVNLVTYTYEVNLPTKAINSNASNKGNGNKTLSWNLATTNNINFEFSFSNNKLSIDNILDSISDENKKYLAYGLIGGGALILIITTIIFVGKTKRQ